MYPRPPGFFIFRQFRVRTREPWRDSPARITANRQTAPIIRFIVSFSGFDSISQNARNARNRPILPERAKSPGRQSSTHNMNAPHVRATGTYRRPFPRIKQFPRFPESPGNSTRYRSPTGSTGAVFRRTGYPRSANPGTAPRKACGEPRRIVRGSARQSEPESAGDRVEQPSDSPQSPRRHVPNRRV